MKTSLINKTIFSIIAATTMITAAIAAPYSKGDKIDSFNSKDQYSVAYDFKPSAMKFLLVSHDMDTGKKANGILTTLDKEYLPSRKAVYLANIHGMPGIGRMFAIPKMKKYAHRIILGDDAGLIAKFPEEKGKVTVITISNGRVKSLKYWSPGEGDLDKLLK